MKTKIVTLENKEAGEVTLNKEIFGLPVRQDILYRVVNWQLANRQAGTHATKGRGDLRGGKKKPYRQKGTGQARQGSTNAPHMRGGGVSFGPQPRSYAIDLPKKIRKLGLKVALSAKQAEGKLFILQSASIKEAKTSSVAKNLKKIGWDSVLFIDGDQVDANFKKSVANIARVDVLPTVGANVYDILRRENLVITEAGLKKLEERLS